MPYVSNKDQRERDQETIQYEHTVDPTFGEVFAASVGQVFDEGLSISNALNREGWRERERLTKDILKSNDSLNRQDYIDRRGRFDYDRFVEDAGDDRLKTSKQLEEERREHLELRRNYAQDVQERGNGMAQFLGMATGFVLDPINAATLGAGTTVNAGRATTTIGRAMYTAREAAVISGATELAIQPFVYEHKNAIDSPYAFDDALEAILGATIGGGAIGAFTGGISGFAKSVREGAEELPPTKELEAAKDAMASLEQTLKNAPDKTPEGEAAFLRQLEEQKVVSDAPSRTLDQYEVPESVVDEPSYSVVNEVVLDGDTVPANLAGGRESELLMEFGIKEDFDRDMIAFSQIEAPKAIIDDEIVDAGDLMKSFDDELEGINSLLVCTRG